MMETALGLLEGVLPALHCPDSVRWVGGHCLEPLPQSLGCVTHPLHSHTTHTVIACFRIHVLSLVDVDPAMHSYACRLRYKYVDFQPFCGRRGCEASTW